MRIPLLIINFKNYPEIAGSKSIELAKESEKVAREIGAEIAVAPPVPLLSLVAHQVSIPVLAQHVETSEYGSTTGAIVPEIVKSAGVVGSLINHSERRLPFEEIRNIVTKLRNLGLSSVVCAKTPAEVSKLSRLSPEMLAIEPPELIGSGRAVSKVKPQLVSRSVNAAKRFNPKVTVICGAGIVEGRDVEMALELGAKGVLVSSAIVKAQNWYSKIKELASPLTR